MINIGDAVRQGHFGLQKQVKYTLSRNKVYLAENIRDFLDNRHLLETTPKFSPEVSRGGAAIIFSNINIYPEEGRFRMCDLSGEVPVWNTSLVHPISGKKVSSGLDLDNFVEGRFFYACCIYKSDKDTLGFLSCQKFYNHPEPEIPDNLEGLSFA